MLRGRHWSRDFHGGHRLLAAVAVLAASAAGCKSGTWGSKPSWWSFGGSTPNESLAAAPSFNTDVVQPSETAKPYPTTDTPEGYVLSDATRTGPDTDSPAADLVDAGSVTYGTTRPTAPPATSTVGNQPTAGTEPTVGPQVGPYASLSQQAAPAANPAGPVDPAEAATAGLAAAPAFNQQPSGPGAFGQGPAAGYASSPPPAAEPRGADRWASATPPTSAAPPAVGGSRYSQHSSRFSGGSQFPPPSEAAAPPAVPAADPLAGLSVTTPETGSAGLTTASPTTPGPVGHPAIEPAASSTAPTTPAEQVLPGSLTPPQRRPDPGYRPGGTSSYRPNRAILAEDPAAGGDVIPAAFQATPGNSAEGL